MAKSFQVIDLSHSLCQGEPETNALPRFASWWYANQERGDTVNFQAMLISEHTGTNVDAPRHILMDGDTIDKLPVHAFIGPAVILDLRHKKPLAEVSPQVIRAG